MSTPTRTPFVVLCYKCKKKIAFEDLRAHFLREHGSGIPLAKWNRMHEAALKEWREENGIPPTQKIKDDPSLSALENQMRREEEIRSLDLKSKIRHVAVSIPKGAGGSSAGTWASKHKRKP